jgi:NADPH-dependent glutamate synthase beta subunit-like oxidoreductase
VGFGRARPLGTPGEDLPGVFDGLSLLATVRRGEPADVGPDVAVGGAGNTAMDVARTVRRLGARATVWYRRTERDMPAFRLEVDEAKHEGVQFRFLAAPRGVERAANGRLRVTFATMELSGKDAAGRPKPVAVEGRDVVVEVDALVKALGEAVDEEALPHGAVVHDGRVVHAGDDGGATPAGDCADGTGATVSEAIRSGRLAAHALHAELTGTVVPAASPLADRGTDPEVAKYKQLNVARFAKTPPAAPPTLPVAQRLASFAPVEGALSTEQARAEAERCFKCGTCVECDLCYHLCPDMAISKRPGGGYLIDLAHCKGCGVCAQECPRAAVQLRKST